MLERIITHNEPLCDGTPRYEKGYRAYVRTVGPDAGRYGGLQVRYWQSPLLPTQDDATAWQPLTLNN